MRLVCWYCLQLVVFLQISCSSPSPEESKHNQKDTLIDKDLALKFFHDLGKRVHESVLWLGSIPRHLVRKAAVSHSDAHIVLHVYHFLNNTHHHMHTHEAGVHHFRNLLTHGHQCTPEQTKIQESILSHEDVLDICSEVEWYKLAHLAWPQATTIIDVGANRGYLGALFLGLWGGGGLKVAPRSIYDVALIDDLFTGTMQVQGYCEDGYDYAIPLFCSNHSRDVKTGICNEENLSISIHSVDGNSILAKTIQSVIAHNMTNESVRSGKVWKYHNYALSESEGTVGLTDYFEAPNGTLPVTTTVDLFMQSQHIESLDILKIDAGGSDMSVIQGAAHALRRSIGLLTFEHQAKSDFNFSFVDQIDSLGFSCFGTSTQGLLKFNGGCLPRDVNITRHKSNIFCASRTVAPLLALLFDILSFPMIFQAAFDKNETAYESVKSITNDTEYDAAIAHILEMVRIDRHYRG